MAIYMDEIKSQLKASLAQHLAATNVVIDGETLRARVRAAEIQGRLEDMVRWCHHWGCGEMKSILRMWWDGFRIIFVWRCHHIIICISINIIITALPAVKSVFLPPALLHYALMIMPPGVKIKTRCGARSTGGSRISLTGATFTRWSSPRRSSFTTRNRTRSQTSGASVICCPCLK